MTLAEAIIFALEVAVQQVLEDIHDEDHRDRVTLVEAARLIEEMSVPWREQVLTQREGLNGE